MAPEPVAVEAAPQAPAEPAPAEPAPAEPAPDAQEPRGEWIPDPDAGGILAAAPAQDSLAPWADKLLPWSEKKNELTKLYLDEHCGASCGVVEAPLTDANGKVRPSWKMTPQAVVLHWTAGCSYMGVWNTFAPDTLSGRPELKGGGLLNVGAQFIVDRDGSIYRIVEEDRVVRHAIGMNHLAIGVENVGHPDTCPLTDDQVASNARLVAYLREKYPTIQTVVGHLEVEKMRGVSPLFVELDASYKNSKPDPGAAFMEKVRATPELTGVQGLPAPVGGGK